MPANDLVVQRRSADKLKVGDSILTPRATIEDITKIEPVAAMGTAIYFITTHTGDIVRFFAADDVLVVY